MPLQTLMFKFLHAADIHLDSPLLGLEKYEGAPVDEIRGATRKALANLVALAIEEAVDFVLIAGDLYDGEWKDAGTGLYFVRQMARLREANIPVYLIAGNHDAQNKMTKELRFPDNVTIFPHRKPGTARIERLNVVIHGQSYATGDVRENLAAGYPEAAGDAFHIGMLHTCGAGAEGHAPYAPCTVAQLAGKGYQYWALGHVHTAQVLSEDPPMVFPGNIQGRHIREAGPRGCLLVQVNERHETARTFVPLDVMRWTLCEIDAAGAESRGEVLERFAKRLPALLAENDGLPLAIRVRISGATGAHRVLTAGRSDLREQLQGVGVDLGNGSVWIEKVVIATEPESVTPIPEGPIAELKAYLEELRGSEEEYAALLSELDSIREFLPADLREACEPADRAALLGEVEALLLERLLGAEVAR